MKGSGHMVGIPLGLWPRQSRQLPSAQGAPGAEGQLPSFGAYIQIFMVGRKPSRAQGPLSGGRARGYWRWQPRPPSAQKALIPSGTG